MSLSRIPMWITLRVIVAAACCFGIWHSLKLAGADYFFRLDTEQSIRFAIQEVPDGWEYYMRLAQFDRAHAQALLATSLRLNEFDAQAWIELGLRHEADGDLGRAENELLTAYAIDHTYVPRWTLANYYFRRENMPAFWQWAHSAAAMPADDIGGLLDLCWRASNDPQLIIRALVNDDPKMLRQFVRFLSDKGQPGAVAAVVPRLIRSGDSELDRPLMLDVINRLVAADDASTATAVWRTLIGQHWVNADTTVPNNAEFQREPLPVSFDWALPEYNGLHSWPGGAGLDSEFTGSEPEVCVVVEQVVALPPGNYSMSFLYRTLNIPPGTGLRWQVLGAKSNAILGESQDISSPELMYSGFGFTVPDGTSLQRIRLSYRRNLGTPRISGTVYVLSMQVGALSKS